MGLPHKAELAFKIARTLQHREDMSRHWHRFKLKPCGVKREYLNILFGNVDVAML
ncbi:uncharacterized protein G2W53_034012 [Senna tora]|uniref:Uncharacterized protein n=1 Tax=Senna tora TaxID=362788 RepID=A0A834WBH9_9FABA|nr:uncharacterized protein G2W53_034012 [Senna tora]